MNGYIDNPTLILKALEEAKAAAKVLHLIATEQLQGASMLKETASVRDRLLNSIEVIEL